MTLRPTNCDELVQSIRENSRVIAVGASTKPRLAEVRKEYARCDLTQLTGIVEYQPDEFTVTAFAGTPLVDLSRVLEEKSQYLPFDPPWIQSGSTLGGTIAAGMNGPGRFRYGGLRDFVLEVRFVDGVGNLLRMGAKVVKNSAGFDLPKFFVGSLGRFGVIAEVTLKVFPRRPAHLTLAIPVGADFGQQIIQLVGRSRWEVDAIDLSPVEDVLYVRLAGPARSLPTIAEQIVAAWPGRVLDEGEAGLFWTHLNEFRWVFPGGSLFKIPIGSDQVAELRRWVVGLGGRVHISGGGNVAFISMKADAETSELERELAMRQMRGLRLQGRGPLRVGLWASFRIESDLKRVLDPVQRFPGLEED